MKKVFIPVVVTLLSVVALANNAEAATSESSAAWDSPESIETAANVIGVSMAQAAEDLAVQHEGHQTITNLMDAGDEVWFDNSTATIHVYGPASPVAIPPVIAEHIVHDTQPHVFPARTPELTAASCGTSRITQEYCSPLQPGVRISHKSGSYDDDCTAGFMVRGYGNDEIAYMLSAAHCNIYGTTFYENSYTSKLWPAKTNCTMGPWTHGVSPWSGYDASITQITGCGGVIPYMHNWETGEDTHEEGATNSYVGEYVCHWGVTSLHQCGTEVATNVASTVSYEESGSGKWSIKETNQVCGYAASGDSGGPVTSGTYLGDATGILIAVGPEKKCGGDNTLWVEQRISSVLNLFDVYIAAS